MNLTSFARLATQFYNAGICVYLKSGPGRGKTTTIIGAVPSIAKDTGRNLGLVVINAPLLTPADTVGYLVPVKREDASGNTRVESQYTDPFWWRTVDGQRLEEYEGGIVFVDEADKADVDVKKVLGEMALSGRCGPHILPPGWVVWMAGNRSTDRSGSTKELDHLINRRMEIDVTDDIHGWEQWASRNGVHHSLLAFAVGNPQIVFPEKPPEKQGPFCTPRSLVNLGHMLVTMAGNTTPGGGGAVSLPTNTDAVEVAAGMIGEAAAAQLFATIRLEAELPSIHDIIASPDTAKLPSAPDAQMLVCYKLASIVEVNDDKQLAAIVRYIERLPEDFAVTFGKSITGRVPMVITKKPFSEFLGRHSNLILMIQSLGK